MGECYIRSFSEAGVKVAYITMAFPVPSETFACNDVRELHRRGIRVAVHSLKRPHQYAPRLTRERGLNDICVTHGDNKAVMRGIRLAVRKPKRLLSLLRFIVSTSWYQPIQLIKSLSFVPRVLDIHAHVLADQPQVIHLFWGHYPSLVGFLVKQSRPSTVLSMFLGAYDLERSYGGSIAIAQEADIIWTHAKVNVSIIEQLGIPKEKIQVVYRGVDVERITDAEATKTKIPKRIVSAGRLVANKGFHDVINTFYRAYQQHSDVSLVILGDGPQRKQLENHVDSLGLRKVVQFLGHVPHEIVLEHMQRADVFLFMSKKERLPNVVKEAMASKCACIVSKTIGIEELIPNSDYGFVVPVGDVESASKILSAILHDDKRRLAIGENAKSHVRQFFSLRRSMEQYIGCWSILVDTKFIHHALSHEKETSCHARSAKTIQ